MRKIMSVLAFIVGIFTFAGIQSANAQYNYVPCQTNVGGPCGRDGIQFQYQQLQGYYASRSAMDGRTYIAPRPDMSRLPPEGTYPNGTPGFAVGGSVQPGGHARGSVQSGGYDQGAVQRGGGWQSVGPTTTTALRCRVGRPDGSFYYIPGLCPR